MSKVKLEVTEIQKYYDYDVPVFIYKENRKDWGIIVKRDGEYEYIADNGYTQGFPRLSNLNEMINKVKSYGYMIADKITLKIN